MTKNVDFGAELLLTSMVTLDKFLCFSLSLFICKIEMIKYLLDTVLLRLNELLHIHLSVVPNE